MPALAAVGASRVPSLRRGLASVRRPRARGALRGSLATRVMAASAAHLPPRPPDRPERFGRVRRGRPDRRRGRERSHRRLPARRPRALRPRARGAPPRRRARARHPRGRDLGASWARLPDERAAAARERARPGAQRPTEAVAPPAADAPSRRGVPRPVRPGRGAHGRRLRGPAAALEATLPRGAVQLGADVRAAAARPAALGGGCALTPFTAAESGIRSAAPPTSESKSSSPRAASSSRSPRVAPRGSRLDPPLPPRKAATMAGAQTWAGDWCKVVATFSRALWRDRSPHDSGVSRPGTTFRRRRAALFQVTWKPPIARPRRARGRARGRALRPGRVRGASTRSGRRRISSPVWQSPPRATRRAPSSAARSAPRSSTSASWTCTTRAGSRSR